MRVSGERNNRESFSLVVDGPLFQLLRRAHLSGDALEGLPKRIVVFALLTWLPLVALSAVDGHMSGGRVNVPFLRDFDAHIRFLVALPLLMVAELVAHRRMQPMLEQFPSRRLIPETAMPRFDAAIASALRLRDSAFPEVLLIAFVYGTGILLVSRHYMALGPTTWYATPSSDGVKLTTAGLWYAFVSLPIFQFILYRWYFRLLVLARLLWRISRISLELVPTHPDRVGGLGFLATTVYGFAPLAAAHGALLAGLLANRIFYARAALPDFTLEVASVVLFMLCLTVGPMLVFTPQLALARRTGNREYGTLAERYVRAFDTKWLRGGAPADELFIGNADIQSLADLSNSFEIVRSMRLVPVTRGAMIGIAVATVAPILPLFLTMMPLEDLVRVLFGMLVSASPVKLPGPSAN